MAETSNGDWISKMALVVGLVSSGLYIHNHWNTPPVPKCPQCRLPQSQPSQRYSKCPRCAQLLDWMVPA